MIDPLVAVARILQRMRLSRDWSLAELSESSGVNALTILAYETDPQSLSLQTALRIFRGMPPKPGGEDFPQAMNPAPQDVLAHRDSCLRELEAATCIDEGRILDALDKLDQALAVCREPDRVGRVQLSRAAILSELGREEEAWDALREAERCFVPRAKTPELYLRLRMDQAYLLCQAERYGEAEPMLKEILDLVKHVGRTRDDLQARRLSGWIAAGVGRSEEALKILLPVCNELLAFGRSFEAAGVGLDLAALLAALGRPDDVEEIARQLEPLFEEPKLALAGRTALKVFCWAVRRGTFNAELGRRLAVEFRRGVSYLVHPYEIPL